MELQPYVRDVPDFPKPGIVFKDISPLLASPDAFQASIEGLAGFMEELGPVARIAVIESRGFLFGAALSHLTGVGMCLVRKPGKLPCATHKADYALEYGTDTLEVHVDAVATGDRVLIVDDLLATGGTVGAAVKLFQDLGAVVVGAVFVVELDFLGGRERLGTIPTKALLHYD